jgi:hypothetical protein
MLLRANTRGTYANMLVTGFESNLDVRDGTGTALVTPVAGQAVTSLTASLFFNSKGAGVVDNIAYPEDTATAPNKDNDTGLNEVMWFKTAGSNNAFDKDPGINCFDPKAPVFGPAVSLTEGAATPPAGFDVTATYKGAFKDVNDKWATTGKWAVWDSE